MSPLHPSGLYLGVWQEDRLKDGLVNRQLHWMTDRQTGRKTSTQPISSVRQRARQMGTVDSVRFIVILCSVWRKDRENEKKQREKERKKEEEHPCVCRFWRFSVPEHPPQLVLWQAHVLKKQAESEGAVTRKEIQVGGREGGGRQRNRGREQVLEILPFICLSFTPLCSFVVWRSDWFSDAGVPLLIGLLQIWGKQKVGRQRKTERKQKKRHCIKGKEEPNLDWLIFTPCFLYLSRQVLVNFFHFFLEVTFRGKKNKPYQCLIVFVHRIDSLFLSVADFACRVLEGLFSPSLCKHWNPLDSLYMSWSPLT